LVEQATDGPREGLNPPLLFDVIHIFFLAREPRTPGAKEEGVP
jgi:hypothetical protein